MLKKFNQWTFILIIFPILGTFIGFYFKIPLLIVNKSNNFINNVKLSRLIKKQNCNITVLNEIPKNSSIVIGHLYGSPSLHNNLVNENAEKFYY